MSAHFGKQRSLKSVVLCASFDRKQRADTMNARENMRLEKQQHDIEVFKNNVEKTHMAEKNRVKSRMQSLRKTVLCRVQSNESGSSLASTKINEESVHLPRLPSPMENGRKLTREIDSSKSVPDLHMLCGENEHNLTHLPTIEFTNSPRGRRRILVKEHNERTDLNSRRSARTRTQSHSAVEDLNYKLKCPLGANGIKLQSTEQECYETTISNRRELLNVDSFQPKEFNRLSSRRRSLSTGDISLAERINSFLESVENSRVVDSSDSLNGSSSEDEKESI